jgi:predicted MFS family arabinose efflux permease
MLGLIAIAFFMTMFAFPMLTNFPVFAKNVFHGGPKVFTILLSTSGAGSVVGALSVAALGNIKSKGLLALSSLVALGGTISGFALSSNIYLSCVLVFISGAMLMIAFSMISSLVQLITSDQMRGRVMSVYTVAFRGGMPVGSLATGYLLTLFSAPSVFTVIGLLLALLGVYFLVMQRKVAAL